MRVDAAIVALESPIGLHLAPEVERSIAFVGLYGKLHEVCVINGAVKVAIANERRVHRKLAADVALVQLLLDRERHAGYGIGGGIVDCAVVVPGDVRNGDGRR